MSERSCLVGLLAAGLWLSACQETPLAPTDPSAGREAVQIFTAPDPTHAAPSSGVTFDADGEVREYAFLVSFDLILRAAPDLEVGLRVASDVILLQEQFSVVPDGPGGGVDRERFVYESRSDDDRIEPGGETSRSFDVWYTLPRGGREALIIVTLNFVDDIGIEFARTHQVWVQR